MTREFTNDQMFYPAVGDDYHAIVQSGHDAFMNWKGHRLRKVGSRTANYQALYVLWVLKVIEIIVDILEYFLLLLPGDMYRRVRVVMPVSGGEGISECTSDASRSVSEDSSPQSLGNSTPTSNSECSSPSSTVDESSTIATITTEEHITRVLDVS